jgi:O-antigen ligase
MKLAVIPAIFDYNADVPFTLVKALTSHALAYVLAGVIAGLLVQFGPTFLVRSWLHLPILAFFGVNIVASLFAQNSLLALYGAHERMLGLGTVADQMVLYLAVVLLIRTRREAVAIVASIAIGSLIVLGYEGIQFMGRDPLAWGSDSAVRPFSTIGNANSLAEYLTILAVGSAGLAIFEHRHSAMVRGLLVLYAAIALAGAVITQTRSAIFGVLAGTVALVALTWLAHPDRRARLVIVAGVAGAAVLFALVLVATPLGARFFSTVEVSATAEGDTGLRLEGAADVRAALYRISVDMVRDRPLFGFGPDNFLASFPKYRSDHEPIEVQDAPNSSAHSWMAQVAVTSGLLGLAAFVAIPLTGVVLALRRRFQPEAWTALAMVAAFLGEGLTTINAIATDQLFWFAVAAVGWTTAHAGLPQEAMVNRRARPAARNAQANYAPGGATRSALALFAVTLGLGLAVATLNALNASHLVASSQVARRQGHTQQALDLALQATRADSTRAQYWETLGFAYISLDRIRDAASAFEHAGTLAPYEVRYDGNLARAFIVLTQRGDAASGAQARTVAERAVRTDPNNPLANQTRASVMQVTGNLPEALKSVERAMALDRLNAAGATNYPEIYVTGIQVLTSLERSEEAIALARTALARVPELLTQVPIRIELSRALAANGQLTDALTEIDGVLVAQPNHPGARQLRAQIIAALGR